MANTALLQRWFTFNAVGLAGVAVQLGCLAVLVHGAGMHYLPATLLAVEAAVVHNFVWHQRWTWRDRPVRSGRGLAARFARFQALNGAISLAVNSGVMLLLAGAAGVDPVMAGLAAILLASLINFAASDRLVFARGATAAGLVSLLLGLAWPAVATAQGEKAVDGWVRHEAEVDARYRSAAAGTRPFLVQDALPEARGWRPGVLAGGVSLHAIATPDVPGAEIHHWAGAIFIPATTVARVVSHLQEHAGSESRFYEDVIDSRLLAPDGDRVRVFMKLRRTTVLTATFHTEHTVEYRRLGPTRASSRSVATRIRELADAGTPHERERPAGDDRGFLWRLNAYWRFEQSGDGVIVECESVSLSRAVPALIGPVARPVISRIAREALERTLRQMGESLICDLGGCRPPDPPTASLARPEGRAPFRRAHSRSSCAVVDRVPINPARAAAEAHP